MCGIAGIVNIREGLPSPSPEALAVMCGALAHRGPDEFGVYRDQVAGLAHSRLSIIDLATGQQPLSNEDQTLWIVLNGEIYNYVELAQELAARGHRFKTRSDTEVVIHAWEEWGEDALRKFNGQWAFALWDAARRELVFSRDRVGILPLYLVEKDGRVLFASELKAVFASQPSLPRALDPYGLQQTFTFWSIVPPRSVFQGVQEIPPGHVRRYSGETIQDRVYWKLSYPTDADSRFAGTLEQAKEAVAHALAQATALRMLRADVPVGCYLSGGLDSSLVAALGLQAKGERFQTFSLRFKDQEYDETYFQRLMAEHLGTEHHEVEVSKEDICQSFPEVVRQAERPILRTAPAPLYLLSRLVREAGIKVVITGEGADEIFAGYDIFREGIIRRKWAQDPTSSAIPEMLDSLYPYLARSPVSQRAMARHFFGRNLECWREPGFAHELRWHTTGALIRLFSPAMREQMGSQNVIEDLLSDLPKDFSRWTHLAQDQYLEMRTLLSGYLLSSQGDRMLMAHSVEGRFPYLDPDIIDLANSLPDDYKVAGLDEKHVLKGCGQALLPEAILHRSKQPYRAPDALSFMEGRAPDWVEEMMSEAALRNAGVFDVEVVRRLWNKCQLRAEQGQFSNTDNMAVVGVLSTQLLVEEFIRRCPTAQPPSVIKTVIDRVNP